MSTDRRPGTVRDRAVAGAAYALATVHFGISLAGLAAFLDAPGWTGGFAGPADGALIAAAVALAGAVGAWRGGLPATTTERARRIELAGGLVVLPGAWVALLIAFVPRNVLAGVPFDLLPLAANALPALAVLVVVYGFGPFAAGEDARRDVDLDWNERN
ncbi:hypothetical protein [Halobaculum magnesiiphilum]|uniref:Uncharacterized protein n=1 Tax=Halobaculum magnesiiphilum TaxID=1017351 RepID=A0A8T8WB02_9EURY|nr:hypothetical protein [Halobaculum magnesiiphilum]QZP37008.1 hypothetical protein K6T50_11995 [Halobaculum magnesiiphilum]